LRYFTILFHGTSIIIYTRIGGNSPRNKTTCVKTSCGNLFTWKKVLYSKYAVREWRQNVLQNLLPFYKNPKNRLLQLSLSLLTDRLQKVLLSRDSEKEKEKKKGGILIGRA